MIITANHKRRIDSQRCNTYPPVTKLLISKVHHWMQKLPHKPMSPTQLKQTSTSLFNQRINYTKPTKKNIKILVTTN